MPVENFFLSISLALFVTVKRISLFFFAERRAVFFACPWLFAYSLDHTAQLTNSWVMKMVNCLSGRCISNCHRLHQFFFSDENRDWVTAARCRGRAIESVRWARVSLTTVIHSLFIRRSSRASIHNLGKRLMNVSKELFFTFLFCVSPPFNWSIPLRSFVARRFFPFCLSVLVFWGEENICDQWSPIIDADRAVFFALMIGIIVAPVWHKNVSFDRTLFIMKKIWNHQKYHTKSEPSFLLSNRAVASVAHRWDDQAVHIERSTVHHLNTVSPVACVDSPYIAHGATSQCTWTRHRSIVPATCLCSASVNSCCSRWDLSSARRCESDPRDIGRKHGRVTDTAASRCC